MTIKTGRIVKRKFGDIVGVVMESKEDPQRSSGLLCKIAFGYMTVQDAKVLNPSKWINVNSNDLVFLND